VVEDDELVLEFVELLAVLHAEELIELSSVRDIMGLAEQLFQLTREDPELDLGDWLLEQDEVSELFIESADLAARAAPSLRRMREGDPEPQWNERLAAAIADAPDDLIARQVFGDWLQQAGDPRGELVAIQVRLAQAPDAELRRREASFLRRFHTYLYGPMAELPHRVTMDYGFFDELSLEAAQLATILPHVAARLARKLLVTGIGDPSSVTTARLPATLVELRLHSLPSDASELHVEAIPGTVRHLEITRFAATHLDLAVVHAAVRVLELASTALVPTGLVAAGATWAHAFPALESLAFDDVTIEPDDLVALYSAPPPSLSSLKLSDHAIAARLSALVGSPLLAQLRTLDLSHNQLAEAVPLILQHADHFKHLEVLDVRRSNLDGELTALGAFVLVDGPEDDEPDADPADEDEDEEDEEDDEYDVPGSDPDAIPEDEPDEVDAEADEAEQAPVDRDAPMEERFEEPE